MIHNLNKEIIYTIDSSAEEQILDYTITINDREVYKGAVLGNGYYVDIDIAPIVRSYHIPTYQNCIGNKDEYNLVGNILEVVVNSNDEDATYMCMHNYNIDGILFSEDKGWLLNPIKKLLSKKQVLNIPFYDHTGSGITIKVYNKSGLIKTITSNQKDAIFNYSLDLSKIKFDWRDFVRIEFNGKSYTYDLVNNECMFRYVLHYKNLLGGIDSMLMEGKAINSISSRDILMDKTSNLTNRNLHNTSIVDRVVTKSYKLNTGVLTDSQSLNIPNLLLSTEIWIEDLKTGNMASVVLKENEHTIKNFKNDKYVSYNLTLEEDNKYIIK